MANKGARDDVLVAVGGIFLSSLGGYLLATLEGWPRLAIGGAMLAVGGYCIAAVWLDWPRPGRRPDDPPLPTSPPPAPPPLPAGPVFKMKGGSGQFRRTSVTGHDRVFDTEDTDIETEDFTVDKGHDD